MAEGNEIICINDIYSHWRYKKLTVSYTRSVVIELKDL